MCGFVLARPGGTFEVVPIENVADRDRSLDSGPSPGTARVGFLMDPLQVVRIFEEMDDAGGEVAAVYHSHVEANALFSSRDREEAVVDGAQQIPGAEYLVVSVRGGVAQELKRFIWDGRDFTESFLTNE